MKMFRSLLQCKLGVTMMRTATLLGAIFICVIQINGHVTKNTDVTTDKIVTVIEANSGDNNNGAINPTVQDTNTTPIAGDTNTTPLKELSDSAYTVKDHYGKIPELKATDRTLLQDNLKANKRNITSLKSTEKYDAKSVYLEDVIFSLKNQNWSKEEFPCLNDTLHLLRSLQNFTLWAVWDWDSISSQPQGLLFGNRYELGNFDECISAPWTQTYPELRTQYCLAEIVLERTDKPVRKSDLTVQPYGSALDFIMRNKSTINRSLNELTWGCCVPVSCEGVTVERLVKTLLARSHLGSAGLRAAIKSTEDCQRQDRPREYDGPFYGFIILLFVLLATCFTCTYLNCNRKNTLSGFKDEMVQAFCLKNNAKALLYIRKEGAEVLYGIRFLTIVFIVMDHQFAFFNSGPIINGLEVDQATQSVVGMFIVHDDLFVDTFFVLSGFLVAIAFKRLTDKRMFNPFLLIIKRYLRLVLAFAVVVFFYVAVYPYIGSGPLWNRSILAETEPCRKNWWLSLLMLGNYIDNENICLVISWYIPCDFHFFVVTALVFWVYTRHRRVGLVCAGVITLVAILTPGVINYLRGLPAIQLFTYDFVKNPRANEQFHVTYLKSHTRFPAYIVGLCAGYLFATYKSHGMLKNMAKKWAVIGAMSGLAIMTAVMLVGTTYLWRTYHPLEGAVYAALNRPIWACGVALLIMCCCLGRVPYVERFLTWYPWVPLSRLAYGLYLTHSAVISRNVYSTRSPQHNDIFTLLTLSLGVTVIGCVASLCIWLFVEAPFNNLFTILIKSRLNRGSPQASEGNLAPTPGPSQCGHLQSNLPATIEISSKM